MFADGEEMREAQERVREAQEGVRETRERLDVDSRQENERDRQSAELGRVEAEGEREQSYRLGVDSRQEQEKDRQSAERGRVAAEEEREESYRQPIWVPQTPKAALLMMLAVFFVASLPPAYLSYAFSTTHSADQADLERLIHDQRAASKQGRHQNCVLFESDHKRDVDSLSDLYGYLRTLSPAEFEQPLNRFILRTLPEREAEAGTDRAPAYCDEPGVRAETLYRLGRGGAPPVGIKEPDPRLPKRPRGLAIP
jgi:hypothetical protein